MQDTGTLVRSMTPGDFPGIAHLKNTINARMGFHLVSTDEEIADEISPPYVNLPADGMCIESEGELVGYVHTYMVDSTERELRCYVFGGVHPDHTGRGHGTTLLRWATGHGRHLLTANPLGLPVALRIESAETEPATIALFRANGYSPVRWFNDLRRPLLDIPEPPAAAACRIVAWDQGRTEELRNVKNVAFRDHWGSTPNSAEDWAQMTNGFGARTDLSFMALVGDDVAGLLLTHRYPGDDDVIGGRYGWVDKLATLPGHRNRGVAKALLVAAMNAYVAEGLTHAALNVDTDSPTGAFGLYSRIGFEPFRGSIVHQFGAGD